MKKRYAENFLFTVITLLLFSCPAGPEAEKTDPNKDSQPPTLIVDNMFDGREVGLTLSLSGTAWDNVAVEGVFLSVDSGPYIVMQDPTNWQTNISFSAGSHLLSFYARNTAGLISAFQVFTVYATATPDTQSPTVTILTPDGVQSVGYLFTATGTASDNGTLEGVYLSLDGGAYQKLLDRTNWNRSFSVQLSGIHGLSAYARDMAGNRSVTNSRYFAVSIFIPSVAITNPTNHCYTGVSNITVSGTSTDDIFIAGVYVELIPNSYGLASGTNAWFTNIVLPPVTGWYTVRCYAMDSSSNASPSDLINVFLDLIPPTNHVTVPTNNQVILVSNFTFYGQIQDNTLPISGLSVEIKLSSGETYVVPADQAGNWGTNLTLTNGTYTASVYALDGVGNSSATNTNTFTVKADIAIPYVSITNFGSGAFLDVPIDIFGISSDDSGVASVTLVIDQTNTNGVIGTTNWRLTGISLPDGYHDIDAFAYDIYNRRSLTANYRIYADSLPPVMTFTSSNLGSSNVRITIQYTDPAGLTNWILARPGDTLQSNEIFDGSTNFTYTEDTNYPDGKYLYRSAGRDIFGHQSALQSNYLIVDGTPPSNWLTKPAQDAILTNPCYVTGHSYDGIALAAVYLGLTNVAGTNTFDLIWYTNDIVTNYSWDLSVDLPEGSNTVRVYSQDRSMNMSQTNSVSFVVDLTPPVLSGISPTDGSTVTTNILISGTAFDLYGLTGVYLSVDAGGFVGMGTNVNWSTNLSLSAGAHTFRVYAADRAGNKSLTNLISLTVTN